MSLPAALAQVSSPGPLPGFPVSTDRTAGYSDEHQAIIDRRLWDKAHAVLKESTRRRAARSRAPNAGHSQRSDLRSGRECDVTTHTRKSGRLYRYCSPRPPRTRASPASLPTALLRTAVKLTALV